MGRVDSLGFVPMDISLKNRVTQGTVASLGMREWV